MTANPSADIRFCDSPTTTSSSSSVNSQSNLLLQQSNEAESDIGVNQQPRIRIPPTIDLLAACSLVVGSVIGSGIFISPTGVLIAAGSPGLSLVIWAVCGLLNAGTMLIFVELSMTFPRTGGTYVWLSEAFGSFPSFIFAWNELILGIPGTVAILALAFAQNLLETFQPNGGSDSTTKPSESSVILLAACAITLSCLVNSVSNEVATKSQNLFSFIKISALIGIGIAGLVYIDGIQNLDPGTAFNGSNWELGKLTLATFSGFFSYGGGNVPLGSVLGTLIVTIIYLFVNVVYFAVLSPEEMIRSSAVAVTFGRKSMGKVAALIPMFVAVSVLGTLHAFLFGASRLFFAVGRDGNMPIVLSMINVRFLTPIPSLIVLSLTSLLYLCKIPIYTLLNYGALEANIVSFAMCAGLVWMRYRRPNIPRPFKLPIGIPIFYILFSFVSLVFPFFEQPYTMLWGILLLCSGLPVYALSWAFQTYQRPAWVRKGMESMTIILQKLLFVLVEDKTE